MHRGNEVRGRNVGTDAEVVLLTSGRGNLISQDHLDTGWEGHVLRPLKVFTGEPGCWNELIWSWLAHMKTEPNSQVIKRMKFVSVVSAAVLSVALATPLSSQAATVKSGAACSKVGRTAKVATRSYRCVKTGGKLKWAIVAKEKAAPDTKAPDTKAPDTKAPDTKAA